MQALAGWTIQKDEASNRVYIADISAIVLLSFWKRINSRLSTTRLWSGRITARIILIIGRLKKIPTIFFRRRRDIRDKG